ncbi:immunity 52 family protein [Atlantibacter hermannii]|uniref:immunity 52 family protein n=1 Tax=Atlantibacter hermannii TaxID=565 RepID=UPI0021675CDC|nr:immunity 52 family protein [Atlantibacter hermannii]
MILNFRLEQEFGLKEPIDISCAAMIFSDVCKNFDVMLETQKKWFEKGCSRKQALQHQIFEQESISKDVQARWEKRYKKNFPFFGEGVWDGEADENSAGIDLTSSISSTCRRANPMMLTIEFPINITTTKLSLDRIINFIQHLLELNVYCTYLSIESGGYSFPEIQVKENGYSEIYKKVFPDRISCGWMLYVPHVLLPELIPEAARVIPVMDGKQQKGTIVVSTEEIFDGNNKEHVGKANDIEIKLLDLGLLPLMTEL